MVKILLLGDVHSNFPALEAVAAAVKGIRFDHIVNTGDFTVYSTFPNETIDWFRRRANSYCILGNTDKRIIRILKGKKLKKPKMEQKRVMYYWTAETLTRRNLKYLKSLPKRTALTVDGLRIGIFHGTRSNANQTLFPTAPRKVFRELAKGDRYQIQVMGHSHVPFYTRVGGVHFINPGSVGRMFDGDPRASYAIMTIRQGKPSVTHYRVPYAIDKVVTGISQHRLPAIYGTMFRRGRKLN